MTQTAGDKGAPVGGDGVLPSERGGCGGLTAVRGLTALLGWPDLSRLISLGVRPLGWAPGNTAVNAGDGNYTNNNNRLSEPLDVRGGLSIRACMCVCAYVYV